jgi:hypothetical protein
MMHEEFETRQSGASDWLQHHERPNQQFSVDGSNSAVKSSIADAHELPVVDMLVLIATT